MVGQHLGQVLERLGGERGRHAAEERAERLLRVLTLVPVERQQPIDGIGQPVHRHLRHHLAELRALVCTPAADQHEVLRQGLTGDLAHAPLEAERGDVVLAAAVRAAADLDIARRDSVNEFRVGAQVLGEQPPEATRLRHRQLARLRAGAADDVAEGIGIGRPHAGSVEPLIERVDGVHLHPPVDDVLINRQTDGAVAVRFGEVCEHAHLP